MEQLGIQQTFAFDDHFRVFGWWPWCRRVGLLLFGSQSSDDMSQSILKVHSCVATIAIKTNP